MSIIVYLLTTFIFILVTMRLTIYLTQFTSNSRVEMNVQNTIRNALTAHVNVRSSLTCLISHKKWRMIEPRHNHSVKMSRHKYVTIVSRDKNNTVTRWHLAAATCDN